VLGCCRIASHRASPPRLRSTALPSSPMLAPDLPRRLLACPADERNRAHGWSFGPPTRRCAGRLGRCCRSSAETPGSHGCLKTASLSGRGHSEKARIFPKSRHLNFVFPFPSPKAISIENFLGNEAEGNACHTKFRLPKFLCAMAPLIDPI